MHGEVYDGLDLGAIVNPSMILAPCALLSIAEKIRAGNMMMMAHLAPSQPRKEALSAIRMHPMIFSLGINRFILDGIQKHLSDSAIYAKNHHRG